MKSGRSTSHPHNPQPEKQIINNKKKTKQKQTKKQTRKNRKNEKQTEA
jgi:hypothetical protein